MNRPQLFIPHVPISFLFLPAASWLQAVSCGHRFTAAVTANGEVWTWGEGGSGQLGYGPISRQTRPQLAIAKDPDTGAGTLRFPHSQCWKEIGRFNIER
jgi:alpha-tubulin suppressor-like RCC1 family protein